MVVLGLFARRDSFQRPAFVQSAQEIGWRVVEEDDREADLSSSDTPQAHPIQMSSPERSPKSLVISDHSEQEAGRPGESAQQDFLGFLFVFPLLLLLLLVVVAVVVVVVGGCGCCCCCWS